jgi:hypothetical protein
MARPLLSERDYERIARDPEKAMEVLKEFVRRKPGRPKKEGALTGAERQRRYMERKRELAQRRERQ